MTLIPVMEAPPAAGSRTRDQSPCSSLHLPDGDHAMSSRTSRASARSARWTWCRRARCPTAKLPRRTGASRHGTIAGSISTDPSMRVWFLKPSAVNPERKLALKPESRLRLIDVSECASVECGSHSSRLTFIRAMLRATAMLKGIIDFSLKNKFIVLLGDARAGARRRLRRSQHSAGRHSRPLGRAGHHLHRMAGPGAADRPGPGHLSDHDQDAFGAAKRKSCAAIRSTASRSSM